MTIAQVFMNIWVEELEISGFKSGKWSVEFY